MTRPSMYLVNKEVPDETLLNTIKGKVEDGKSPKKIKSELSNVSLYIIRRYYTKIIKGIW